MDLTKLYQALTLILPIIPQLIKLFSKDKKNET